MLKHMYNNLYVVKKHARMEPVHSKANKVTWNQQSAIYILVYPCNFYISFHI